MRHAMSAEWTKLRTVPGNAWLLLAAVAVTVAASALTTSIVRCQAGCGTDPATLSLAGVAWGQAVVVIVAVLAVSGEYGSGLISATLTAIPRRSVMMAAKSAVVGAVVAVVSVVAVLGSLLADRIVSPTGGPMPRAAGGSVLHLVLIALLSLGVAAAVRDSALAMTVVLGLLYVVPVIGHVLVNPAWQRRVERYTPMNAGLGVVAAWAAAALIVGWVLLLWRDA